MDDADIARRNDEFFGRLALVNHRAASGGDIIETYRCIECGRRIPYRRIEACRMAGLGCTRCIECQAMIEGRKR